MDENRKPGDHRPSPDRPEGAAAPEPPQQAPDVPLREVIRRHRGRLLAIDGVQGLDHGRAADGTDVIRVHIRDASVRRAVPGELDGHPVTTIVTGRFKAR
ncbi:hypothetical protein E1200_06720 [Actinomadura sp. GC306]|uniref:hypothetical protein n=1 Tax=Actinomadura sp. GC306 TaxID=2530367 RepID=UPI00104CD2BE|nr:hypothetical protein [Actinomadura sp. GC306]TDC69983.1 hypothetical protein E1200_06720 [Actinomadura sp. GC306]